MFRASLSTPSLAFKRKFIHLAIYQKALNPSGYAVFENHNMNKFYFKFKQS